MKNRLSLARVSAIFGLSFFLLAASPGCLKETEPVAVASREPLIVDEAMQRRDWPRSVVHFANGETPATPTGFVIEHNPNVPKWVPALTDGPMFAVNVVALPIGYIFAPPWRPVIYPNSVTEPSYNAMPPLPPK